MIEIPGKVPIQIHPVFWILILVIGFLSTGSLFGMLLLAPIILFSLLIHEFGHALTALAFGQRATISLVAFGGVTHRYGGVTKLWQDFLIVLNGPLAGFFLSLVAFVLYRRFPHEEGSLTAVVLVLIFNVNLFWTILNLLPVQPLDGGHLLRIVFEGFFGFRGIRYALLVSTIISFAACFFFFSLRYLIGGIIFLILGVENFRGWRSVAGMTAEDYHHPKESLLEEGYRSLERGDFARAENQLRIVYEETHEGLLHVEAARGLARSLVEQGGVEEPYSLLLPLQNQLEADALSLLHQLAYRMEDWEKVRTIGNKVYQYAPSSDVAIANACAAAHFRAGEEAVGWLHCAWQEGAENLHTVVKRPVFDSIRYEEIFQRFVSTTGE